MGGGEVTVTKGDLDDRVAQAISKSTQGTSHRVISVVTSSFLEELQNALVIEGNVYLPGIGHLHVSEYKGNNANLVSSAGKRTVVDPTHIRVSFRKAPALREALKRRKKT